MPVRMDEDKKYAAMTVPASAPVLSIADWLKRLARLTNGREVEYDTEESNEKKNHPPEYICPISFELFEDPVVTADGHTYERACIQKHFKLHKATSPMTNAELPHTQLVPNINLKQSIAKYRLDNNIRTDTLLVLRDINDSLVEEKIKVDVDRDTVKDLYTAFALVVAAAHSPCQIRLFVDFQLLCPASSALLKRHLKRTSFVRFFVEPPRINEPVLACVQELTATHFSLAVDKEDTWEMVLRRLFWEKGHQVQRVVCEGKVIYRGTGKEHGYPQIKDGLTFELMLPNPSLLLD